MTNELEIHGPTAECGDCGFTAALAGKWSVEDGRLVFRADADPLVRRGPSLNYCGESRDVVEFDRLTVDGHALTDDSFASLRSTAENDG